MERISNFDQLSSSIKLRAKALTMSSFVSTMELAIVPIEDGTAITMKV